MKFLKNLIFTTILLQMARNYTARVNLFHNERPASVNMETGEVKVKKNHFNNLPEGKEVFEPEAFFQKMYSSSWKYLEKNTTNIEFAAAMRLALLAKANTSSLEPLNDNTTILELVSVLGVSKNRVDKVLRVLFELGVYGKFETVGAETGYTKYWIFNPFLIFSGKIVNSDIKGLFKNTKVAKAFYNPDYGIAPKSKSKEI